MAIVSSDVEPVGTTDGSRFSSAGVSGDAPWPPRGVLASLSNDISASSLDVEVLRDVDMSSASLSSRGPGSPEDQSRPKNAPDGSGVNMP